VRNMNGKLSAGLDIGTTTISAVVLDTETGEVCAVRNVPNDGEMVSAFSWEHRQDPEKILSAVTGLLREITDTYRISSIGITGQMHGILYVSPEGKALSPLYTWQDGRAGLGTPSACEMIRQKTGYRVPAGYGLATHYALSLLGEAPLPAYLCTIMDYTAMVLCGLPKPVIHTTNAASLGLFRIGYGRFDEKALTVLGLEPAMLPEVTDRYEILGHWQGIPVSVGIGDNQAAFLGSVREPENTVLVNIGTGSQISVLCGRNAELMEGAVETRPFDEHTCLLSGSGLCGGRAYAMLERFFRGYAAALGLPEREQYETMNALAAKGLEEKNILHVRTTFCGTRDDPDLRGEITGIGEEDLTPEGLCSGVLTGMAAELYGMYETMPHGKAAFLTASGNGVRKNPVLQKILEEMFGMPVRIPVYTEEAALGAAVFAARANGAADLRHCIRYQTHQ